MEIIATYPEINFRSEEQDMAKKSDTINVEFELDDFKKLLLFLAYSSKADLGGMNLLKVYQTLDAAAIRFDIDCDGRSDGELEGGQLS